MKFSIQNYELQSDKVIAYLTDGTTDVQYSIDREKFENWLTDGTGVVDASFTATGENGEITDVTCIIPIAQYWTDAKEVNNMSVLEHLHMYLSVDEVVKADVIASFKYQEISDLLDLEVDSTALRYKIKSMIIDYASSSRQWIIKYGSSIKSNAA